MKARITKRTKIKDETGVVVEIDFSGAIFEPPNLIIQSFTFGLAGADLSLTKQQQIAKVRTLVEDLFARLPEEETINEEFDL